MHVWFSTLVAALLSVVTRGLPWPRTTVLEVELAALRVAIEEQFPAADLHFDGDLGVLMLEHSVIGIPLQRLRWLHAERPERVPHEVHHILADCRRCLQRPRATTVPDRALVEKTVLPLLAPHLRVERSDEYRLLAHPLTPELDVTFHYVGPAPGRMTVADANTLGFTPEQLAEAAYRNMIAQAGATRWIRSDAAPTAWLEIHIDSLPASTIALRADLAAVLEGRSSTDLLIALPSVESALFLPNPSQEATARLLDRVVDTWAAQPGFLTTQIYRLRMGRLTPWPANA